MPNFKGNPPAGRPLPSNWQSLAQANAAQADADYRHQIENAWRQPMQGDAGLMQAARLRQQPPSQQPAPKRSEARSDTRMDGVMTLIKDDSFEQVWRDSNGSTIVIKKRK